jgi:hypothetical protein
MGRSDPLRLKSRLDLSGRKAYRVRLGAGLSLVPGVRTGATHSLGVVPGVSGPLRCSLNLVRKRHPYLVVRVRDGCGHHGRGQRRFPPSPHPGLCVVAQTVARGWPLPGGSYSRVRRLEQWPCSRSRNACGRAAEARQHGDRAACWRSNAFAPCVQPDRFAQPTARGRSSGEARRATRSPQER